MAQLRCLGAAEDVDAAEPVVADRSRAPVAQLRWRPAYVGLGSNLQDPRDRVLEAFRRLASVRSTRLELRSSLYRTHPHGPQDQPEFVNAAAGMLTQLAPHELLGELQDIERTMGRERRERWGPRVIDLDLLWMSGSAADEESLVLPHPGVSVRNFVLYPLCDIAPTLSIQGHGLVMNLKALAGGAGISVL